MVQIIRVQNMQGGSGGGATNNGGNGITIFNQSFQTLRIGGGGGGCGLQGGVGGTCGTPATNATGYGNGGGGGAGFDLDGSTGANGGNGSNGLVVIDYIPIKYDKCKTEKSCKLEKIKCDNTSDNIINSDKSLANFSPSVSVVANTTTEIDYCSLSNGSIYPGDNMYPPNPRYIESGSIDVSSDDINKYISQGYNYAYFEGGAAGGGGGAGISTTGGGGGGGGSGETYSVIFQLSELISINVDNPKLGLAGLGGTVVLPTGITGGDTSFTINAHFNLGNFSNNIKLKGGLGGTSSNGGNGYYGGGGGNSIGGTGNSCANIHGHANGYNGSNPSIPLYKAGPGGGPLVTDIPLPDGTYGPTGGLAGSSLFNTFYTFYGGGGGGGICGGTGGGIEQINNNEYIISAATNGKFSGGGGGGYYYQNVDGQNPGGNGSPGYILLLFY